MRFDDTNPAKENAEFEKVRNLLIQSDAEGIYQKTFWMEKFDGFIHLIHVASVAPKEDEATLFYGIVTKYP